MDSYISLEEFKASYLYGIDVSPLTKAGIDLDAFITQQLKLAKNVIDRKASQSIEETEIGNGDGSFYYRGDGNSKWTMVLPNFPIKTVSSCRVMYGWSSQMYNFSAIKHTASRKLGINGDPITDTCDLMVDRDKGIIDINPSSLTLLSSLGQSPLWQQNFSEGRLAVVVSYIYGYAIIPEDIKAANAKLVAIALMQASAARQSAGATSVRILSVSRTWGPKAYQSQIDQYTQEIEDAVAYYKVHETSI